MKLKLCQLLAILVQYEFKLDMIGPVDNPATPGLLKNIMISLDKFRSYHGKCK